MLTTHSKKSELAGLHYCTNHTGKMAGLESLSTSVNANPYCIKRMQNGNSICSHCFSFSMMKQYKALNECTSKNAEILTSGIIPADQLPLTPTRYFRFESFGDIINANQVINYFNIAKKNPETRFALWTKNPHIVNKAIESGHSKPANLQIVLSSPIVNKPVKSVKYGFIDKVFTVYDKTGSKQVNVNCGARSCLGCGLCYRPNPAGVGVVYVNEILK